MAKRTVRTRDEKLPPHPMQPILLDQRGKARFRSNPLVEWILEENREGRVVDLNRIAKEGWRDLWTDEDYAHFIQLLGYSISGFAEVGGVSDELYSRASRAADLLERPNTFECPSLVEVLRPKDSLARWVRLTATTSLRVTVGTPCMVELDNGDLMESVVTTTAWQLSNHRWLIGVEGISGGYAVERVRVRPTW